MDKLGLVALTYVLSMYEAETEWSEIQGLRSKCENESVWKVPWHAICVILDADRAALTNATHPPSFSFYSHIPARTHSLWAVPIFVRMESCFSPRSHSGQITWFLILQICFNLHAYRISGLGHISFLPYVSQWTAFLKPECVPTCQVLSMGSMSEVTWQGRVFLENSR